VVNPVGDLFYEYVGGPIWSWLILRWYIWIGLILLWFLARHRAGRTVTVASRTFSVQDLGIISEVGLGLMIVYLGQRFVFSGHWFWTLSIIMFWAIMFVVYFFIDSRNDVILIEARKQGEILYNLGRLKKKVVAETDIRVFKISAASYREKIHIGDAHPLWWNYGRLIICDYYDGTYIYHPEYFELHNIRFYTCKYWWLWVKEHIPEILKENAELTWTSRVKVAWELKQLEKKSLASFPEISKAIEDTGGEFNLSPSDKELYEMFKKEGYTEDPGKKTPPTRQDDGDKSSVTTEVGDGG